MVTFKLRFRPSMVVGKEGRLYYQVTYRRCVRQVVTDYRIWPDEWNAAEQVIRLDDASPRYVYLLALQKRIDSDCHRFGGMVAAMLAGNRFLTADILVREWQRRVSCTLFGYMEQLVVRLRRQGQLRTAEVYASTLSSFRHFRQGIDLCFEEIDLSVLLAYEYYLRGKALVPNTVAFYMRRLRAVCSRAEEECGVECKMQLFRRVHTAADRTVKRAVSVECIRRVRDFIPLRGVAQAFARDMFLFSFYTRGMSFVDMAYLRKGDLQNGVLSYRRRKTGQLLSLRWESCMQALVDRYPSAPESPYLLPIIAEPAGDVRRQYRKVQAQVNYHLRSIGRMLQMPIALTLYVARHSWASIARSEGVPVAIISEGMGHDSERTTQIYLASLETHRVDSANSKILRLLQPAAEGLRGRRNAEST